MTGDSEGVVVALPSPIKTLKWQPPIELNRCWTHGWPASCRNPPITQKILSLMGIGYFVTTPPQPAIVFTAENKNQVQGWLRFQKVFPDFGNIGAYLPPLLRGENSFARKIWSCLATTVRFFARFWSSSLRGWVSRVLTAKWLFIVHSVRILNKIFIKNSCKLSQFQLPTLMMTSVWRWESVCVSLNLFLYVLVSSAICRHFAAFVVVFRCWNLLSSSPPNCRLVLSFSTTETVSLASLSPGRHQSCETQRAQVEAPSSGSRWQSLENLNNCLLEDYFHACWTTALLLGSQDGATARVTFQSSNVKGLPQTLSTSWMKLKVFRWVSSGMAQNSLCTCRMFVKPICDIVHLAMSYKPAALSSTVFCDLTLCEFPFTVLHDWEPAAPTCQLNAR